MGGFFLDIEGIDGSGKSTQTRQLQAWLTALGIPVHLTAMCSSLMGELIHKVNREGIVLPDRVRSLLYASDVCVRGEQVVAPALEAGACVIADRYLLSLYAYGVTRKVPLEWIKTLSESVPRPDLVVLLDTSPKTAWLRKRENVIHSEAGLGTEMYDQARKERSFLKFQGRLRASFLELGAQIGAVVLDGEQSQEETLCALQTLVLERGEKYINASLHEQEHRSSVR